MPITLSCVSQVINDRIKDQRDSDWKGRSDASFPREQRAHDPGDREQRESEIVGMPWIGIRNVQRVRSPVINDPLSRRSQKSRRVTFHPSQRPLFAVTDVLHLSHPRVQTQLIRIEARVLPELVEAQLQARISQIELEPEIAADENRLVKHCIVAHQPRRDDRDGDPCRKAKTRESMSERSFSPQREKS